MEGVWVLAMVTQRFTLKLVPGQTIVPEPRVTLRPKKRTLMTIWIVIMLIGIRSIGNDGVLK